MDPYHILVALIYRYNRLDVGHIELGVYSPHLVLFFLVIVHVQTLEIMEERPQNRLMERQVLHDLLIIEEYRNTVEFGENLSDLLLLFLVFHENSWPAYPSRFHYRVILLQL